MNAYDRELIEKAGYDNGWEIAESAPSGNTIALASSMHPGRVGIAMREAGGWILDFGGTLSLVELARHVPQEIFDDERVWSPSRAVLADLLARASTLLRHLPSQPLARFSFRWNEVVQADPGILGTEREAIVKQRIGQGFYREALEGYWNGCCSVTGIAVREVLRASHAKPWAECDSDAERLDVFNGFLLSANLDSLFDKGLVSFQDDGLLLLSDRLDPSARKSLGLDSPTSLRWISENHLPYLAWHRANVFKDKAE